MKYEIVLRTPHSKVRWALFQTIYAPFCELANVALYVFLPEKMWSHNFVWQISSLVAAIAEIIHFATFWNYNIFSASPLVSLKLGKNIAKINSRTITTSYTYESLKLNPFFTKLSKCCCHIVVEVQAVKQLAATNFSLNINFNIHSKTLNEIWVGIKACKNCCILPSRMGELGLSLEYIHFDFQIQWLFAASNYFQSDVCPSSASCSK